MPRFLSRSVRALILALPPSTAALLLHLQPDLPGLRMFALIACAYSALAVVAFVLTWRSSVEVGAMARTVAGLEHDLWKQRLELRTQIEVLCAEREIGTVLRDDVDFRLVMERSLKAVARLLGERCAIEVEVGGALKAVWAEGKAWFDRGLAKRAKREGGDAWELERPLAYDGEEIGVLRLRALLDGDFEEREERGRQLAAHGAEIASFVALAIKTPDLYARATLDGLTGLSTKRLFVEQVAVACEAAARYSAPLSLVMVDIDHFKKVNDTHGHLAGDRVLKGVADVIRRSVRGKSGESAYRYGGEEMAILLPRLPLAKAVQVAERVRAGIEAKPIAGIAVTASLGVAQCASKAPEDLVRRADAALYAAKKGGRNRVEKAEPRTQKTESAA
jgi:diguanylate cyclase (GGDEF)-like protein